MNKDREWAFIELGKLYPSYTETYEYPDDITVTKCELLNKVYDILSQLDEPEVLSHEWIERNTSPVDDEGRLYIWKRDLENLIVPKKESPVVPKHVADWITRYREKYDLYPALRLLENNTFVWGEIYEWYRMNTRKFVNAYLTGEYEVEEEPLYYAMVKGHELLDDVAKYWAHNKYDLEDLFISYETRDDSPIVVKNTKKHWSDLNINDSNADFVRVEEV